MADQLFVVVGREDFTRGDEGSLVLCRPCFEADQVKGPGHLATDALAFAASVFLPIEQLECEGHRCCKAHHGQVCVDAREGGYDCRREGKYDERRRMTRERLMSTVINRRIAALETVAIILVIALGVTILFVAHNALKSKGEGLFGGAFTWAFRILGLIWIISGPSYLMFGTIRRKLRLPK